MNASAKAEASGTIRRIRRDIRTSYQEHRLPRTHGDSEPRRSVIRMFMDINQ
jgi:hypothetical protein